MLKAVFFDLDDTLCDDTSAWIACARKATAHGMRLIGAGDHAQIAQRFLDISEQYWSGLDYTHETRDLLTLRTDQFAAALRELEISDTVHAAEAMAAEYSRIRSIEIELLPDATRTLTALRSRGLRLALITNGLKSTHVPKVAHLGLEKLVDDIIIAEAVGWFKPDSRIFAHALALAGCRPSEAIMVGDDLHRDVDGAEAVGVRAIWYNPLNKPLGRGNNPPTLGDIRFLSDVIPIIDSLCPLREPFGLVQATLK